MKELSIEEKAKRYDEALEKSKILYEQGTITESLCYVFPELKESEDENIRKELMEQVVYIVPDKNETDNEGNVLPSYQKRIDKYIAWLEKQGEQKPTDKVEPKFKNGQWIVWQNKCYKVNYNGCGYELIDQNGLSTSLEYVTVDENAHLWTIKDAKPGDILFHSDSASNGIFIFKELLKYEFSEKVICYCDYDSEDHFCLGEHHTCCWADAKILQPATKEQRDTLMKAMADAGYTFNFEKKELRKIENKNPLLSDFFKAEYKRGKADAQKPDGWSENKKLYTIDVYYPTCGSEVKEAIEQGIAYSKTEKKEILISLNGIFLRITPSSTTENVINEYNNYAGKNIVIKEKTNFINQWNNDDELYLKGVITDIECEVLCANCSREIADLKIHWLKSLKDRVQPQVEWGEWGKKYIASTIKMVEHCSFSSIGGITKAAAITWLKSLGPQTIWKPSEKQMDALSNALSLTKDCGEESAFDLRTLYEQLKQL